MTDPTLVTARRHDPGGRLKRFGLPLLVWALVSLAGPPAGAADVRNQERQLAQLRERIAALQERMRRARGQHTSLNRQLEESEQAIGRLARRLRVLRGRLERTNQRLDALHQQEATQQRALAEQRELLARQVRAAYAMGREEQLRILLSQQDPAAVTRVLAYYDYLNRERARRMTQIRERLQALAKTRAEIAHEQEHLRRLQAEQEERKLALEAQQQHRRAVIEQLAREIQGQDSELERLHKDEKQLQALLRGLQQALADIPVAPTEQTPFLRARGRLPWPLKGMIRKAFGDPKIGKLRWDGVMIGAPEGQEVHAIHAGRVAFADWLRGFGLLIIIDHGNGYMTLYGHNQSLFKEAGDWVEAGEPIAAAGNTGGRKETGVYFAIRHNGKPVNPIRWCRRPRGRRVG